MTTSTDDYYEFDDYYVIAKYHDWLRRFYQGRRPTRMTRQEKETFFGINWEVEHTLDSMPSIFQVLKKAIDRDDIGVLEKGIDESSLDIIWNNMTVMQVAVVLAPDSFVVLLSKKGFKATRNGPWRENESSTVPIIPPLLAAVLLGRVDVFQTIVEFNDNILAFVNSRLLTWKNRRIDVWQVILDMTDPGVREDMAIAYLECSRSRAQDVEYYKMLYSHTMSRHAYRVAMWIVDRLGPLIDTHKCYTFTQYWSNPSAATVLLSMGYSPPRFSYRKEYYIQCIRLGDHPLQQERDQVVKSAALALPQDLANMCGDFVIRNLERDRQLA